jgi:hypothetical protein
LDHARPGAESHQCSAAPESVRSRPRNAILYADFSPANLELAFRLAVLKLADRNAKMRLV